MTTPLALALQKAAAQLKPHRDRLVEAWAREMAEVAPRVAPDIRAYAQRNVETLLARLEAGELERLKADDEKDAAASVASLPLVLLAVGAFYRALIPSVIAAAPDRDALAESLVALHELFDRRLEVFLRAQENEIVRRLAEEQDQGAQAAERARELARANEALRRSEAESRHRA